MENLKGAILIVNGPSSSGKTSIVHALQRKLGVPSLAPGIDMFTESMPQGYWCGDYGHLGYKMEKSSEGMVLKAGPFAKEMLKGMYAAWKALAEVGHLLIVDDCIMRETFPLALEGLKGVPVCFIGAYCSLEELERREVRRGNRPVGLARFDYYSVNFHESYDFKVDTTNQMPEASADQIMAFLKGGSLWCGLEPLAEEMACLV